MRAVMRDIASKFTPERAEEIANQVQANDPEWRYVVRHVPGGLSTIEIYDEDELLIGHL